MIDLKIILNISDKCIGNSLIFLAIKRSDSYLTNNAYYKDLP
ncbi:hypothetical protein EAKF1_ch3596 [Escherichia albertii KF1]|nr:hypothetical protein EAKF1_ch3596 [Escherichia albertii KF1]